MSARIKLKIIIEIEGKRCISYSVYKIAVGQFTITTDYSDDPLASSVTKAMTWPQANSYILKQIGYMAIQMIDTCIKVVDVIKY